MLIGYARTSTIEQEAGLEAQMTELSAIGCEKIFKEQVSSVGKRDELDRAVDFCREGDTLVVTKLDRLARSVRHMWDIIERLRNRGADIRILNLGIDSATPTGKLMLNILGGVAEFEREMMLERQREGIAKAKAAGRYKGRKPTARARYPEVLALRAEGLSMDAIARRLNIGKGSVARALALQRSPLIREQPGD
jgi:DNA invertase Pin-like site-specific DNA recombinase